VPGPVLAVGGHLKVTIALAWDRRVSSCRRTSATWARAAASIRAVRPTCSDLYDVAPARPV
jgi:hypothetical protein